MERATNKERRTADDLPSAAVGIIVNGHYAPPPSDEDGKQWVRTSALVLRTPVELYGLWRDVQKAPLWQEQIKEVRATGPKTSHWVMVRGDDPDKTIEWDSEILND